MNEVIVNNLFEFWTFIGQKINKLTEKSGYKAVFVEKSDWPNRVFSISDNKGILSEIIELSLKGLLPRIITCTNPSDLKDNNSTTFLFKQRNMALNLKSIKLSESIDEHIHAVNSSREAEEFAQIATEAFGYCVDAELVNTVRIDSSKVRFFIYHKHAETHACGLVFFDSNNNAGLHMIGTRPKARGQGIGKSMTESLLLEAKAMNSKYCVLHASKMGEKIYKKLGFVPYEELETYQVMLSD